ncbi:MAG: flavodoxin family protein [Desulfarculales bacterium]|nr:flavodoxin family protein [Desulfarculales bacterium]
MLGIYGSPRQGANTSILLDSVLRAAEEAGSKTTRLFLKDMKYAPCDACGGCEENGQCVRNDDIAHIYALIDSCQTVVLAFPVYFYGPPAPVKSFIDRAQANFQASRLNRQDGTNKDRGGAGYLLAAGASKGEKLFAPSELIVKYFFDAVNMDYGGGMFFRGLEGAGAVLRRPDYLKMAGEWGYHLAQQEKEPLNQPFPG